MKLPSALLLLFMSLLYCAGLAQAATPAVGAPVVRQEANAIRQLVQQYLLTQAAGLPGRIEVKVGNLATRLNVPTCAALETFTPSGSRVWGKTTVGVRCNAPQPWTIYVASHVHVWADYVAAAAPLAQGQSIVAAHLAIVSGDLTALPPGVITDPTQAIGRSVALSIQAGSPLRHDALRQQQAVQQGQQVRLISSGPGFRVSMEGKAMTNAAEGQIAQAKTAGGQVVSGIARLGGVVEVTY